MDFSTHHHHHEPEFPIPITTAYVGLHHDPPSNGPSNLTTTTTNNDNTTTTTNTATNTNTTTTTTTKYRECLKNHAASLGGHALDGCGEFMPSGDDGTPDALRCSACHCHRNFHRKEAEGGDFPPFESTYLPPPPHHPLFPTNSTTTRKVVGQKGVLISKTTNSGLIPRATHHHQHMIMPVGGGGAMQTSESDELEVYHPRAPQLVKKRFRTKFTSEQKEKMLEFAERFEWRIPRAEEREVQLFCQEIGVRRRVLKVWMHNNKHTFSRKTSIPTTTTTAAASAASDQPE